MNPNKALTFNDVCLVPQFSTIESRSFPSTTVSLGGLFLTTPIISASMDSVTESAMAIAMYKAGGIGAIHRFMSIENQCQEYLNVKNAKTDCLMTLGVHNYLHSVDKLYALGCRHFIIDIAHGHSAAMRTTLETIRKFYPNVFLMAGNVATPEAVLDLESWGASAIKVGIGSGSICGTRTETGHGIPMFSALLECCNVARVPIVADGGIRSGADLIKSLVAGASCVMVGSLVSGCLETPGEVIDGRKVYRGMASREAQIERGTTVSPEGISTTVKYKGPVKDVIEKLTKSLRSGMSYCNSRTIAEIPIKARWREQSSNGYIEGTYHIL